MAAGDLVTAFFAFSEVDFLGAAVESGFALAVDELVFLAADFLAGVLEGMELWRAVERDVWRQFTH